MSFVKLADTNHVEATVHQSISNSCLTPTTIKVGGVVLGLLLVAAGLTMYFLNINAIAAYITGGMGGASILGVAIWSIKDCLRDINESSKTHKVIEEVKESSINVGVLEFTLDLVQNEGSPKVTEDAVAELLRIYPNLTTLKVTFRPNSLVNNSFEALEANFNRIPGKSSGHEYTFERKV